MDASLRIRCALLGQHYQKAVRHRTNGARVPRPSESLVEGAARMLGDSALVPLFVEAQFDAMPSEWCKQMFKRTYPPANVCFGGDYERRYREYIEKGERKLVT